MDINGKVAVITGAGSGIGAALARALAAEGAHVALADLDGDAAENVAEDIEGAVSYAVDVTDESQVVDLVRNVEEQLGPIDLFCSNAGVLVLDMPGWTAVSAPNDAWQRAWEVHVMAHIYAARACLPGMIQRGSGYLLNTVSAAGLLHQIGGAPYSTTKHAAIGFAESVSITHHDHGIRVSVLCPQGVKTPMVAGAGAMASDGGPAGVDGMLTPEAVVEAALRGLEKEDFLILPHPEVAQYFQNKAEDYDRWLGGMRKLRRRFPFPEPKFD